MSLSDAYATPGQYRASIHKSDPSQDEDLLVDLEAISRIVEAELHEFFNKDDNLVIRYYDARFSPLNNAWLGSGVGYAESENPWRYLRGEPFLDVDPIADITGMQIHLDINRDETYTQLLTTADYILLPRNALVGPEPKPYTQLMRTNNGVWVPGANFKINAIWGWPQVPKAIQRATIQLAALLRIETPRAYSSIDHLSGAMAASQECQDIITSLKRAYKRTVRV